MYCCFQQENRGEVQSSQLQYTDLLSRRTSTRRGKLSHFFFYIFFIFRLLCVVFSFNKNSIIVYQNKCKEYENTWTRGSLYELQLKVCGRNYSVLKRKVSSDLFKQFQKTHSYGKICKLSGLLVNVFFQVF